MPLFPSAPLRDYVHLNNKKGERFHHIRLQRTLKKLSPEYQIIVGKGVQYVYQIKRYYFRENNSIDMAGFKAGKEFSCSQTHKDEKKSTRENTGIEKWGESPINNRRFLYKVYRLVP